MHQKSRNQLSNFNKTTNKSFAEDGEFEVDLNTTTQTYGGPSGLSFTSTARDDYHQKELARKSEANENLKFSMINKFIKSMKNPVYVQTPVNLVNQTRYRMYRTAKIIKNDHDRILVINYMISNVFRVFLFLHDCNWLEAFLTTYANLTIVEEFNEYVVYTKHGLMLALLL